METEKIIHETEQFIRLKFSREGSGHDWFHVDRVRKMALRIGEAEGCDLFLTEMAALLHDLDDWKLTEAAEDQPSGVALFLSGAGVGEPLAGQILQIIEDVSFKGAGVETPVRSAEAAAVQDADRLDAIGAIGIARTFAYGGHKSRPIYDPEISPVLHASFGEYKKNDGPTINHFYEKLLLLKSRMNTPVAKAIAEERHQFMEVFLSRFYDEWNAKR